MNNRTEQFHFFATPEEAKLIRDREKEIGILNESVYLRKMAIDGYVLTLQMTEIRECIHLLRSISNNVNQMAKRANAGGAVDARELGRVREVLEQSWQTMNGLLKRLGEII